MPLEIIIKIIAYGIPALLIILGWISATTGNLLLGIGMMVIGIIWGIADAFILH